MISHMLGCSFRSSDVNSKYTLTDYLTEFGSDLIYLK